MAIKKQGGAGQVTKQQGFTIVEVIVVIVVLAIGTATATSLLSSVQAAQRNAYYLSIATHAARTEIERLRSSGFSSIATDGTYPFSQTLSSLPQGSGSCLVSTPANAPTSKQVDATVTYYVGTQQKQVTISAYIDPPKVITE